MLSKLLLVALCGSLLVSQAGATIVIYKWTPAEILLASDSLAHNARIGKKSGREVSGFGSIVCKIHQQGDAFFAMAGSQGDVIAGMDLLADFRQAARGGGNAAEIMTALDTLAGASIERHIFRGPGELRAKILGPSGVFRLDLYVVDRRSHTLAHQGYGRKDDGSTLREPRKLLGPPNRRAELGVVGIYLEAGETVVSRPGEDWVPFFARFIQAQAAHELVRLARGEVPRVGGEISILRIVGGKAEWVAGHQGECPAVQP